MNLLTTNVMKQRAHQLLDDVRAGINSHDLKAINWALRVLGEPVNA